MWPAVRRSGGQDDIGPDGVAVAAQRKLGDALLVQVDPHPGAFGPDRIRRLVDEPKAGVPNLGAGFDRHPELELTRLTTQFQLAALVVHGAERDDFEFGRGVFGSHGGGGVERRTEADQQSHLSGFHSVHHDHHSSVQRSAQGRAGWFRGAAPAAA